jgi:Zn-dependent peptidase ImmA (M78 family)
MPQREMIQTSAGGLQFEFEWPDATGMIKQFGPSYGYLTVRLGNHSIWSASSTIGQRGGIPGCWIELLEHLSAYWLYLLLEQGYPFNVRPTKPSQLDSELAVRWECMADPKQSDEEEVAYAFRLSHNLAEATPGTLRPDVWFVRDGGMFIVETQTGAHTILEHLHSNEVRTLLTQVGNAIANRLESATDDRSEAARRAWSNRESSSIDVLARIATGLPEQYLRQTCGAAPLGEVFNDSESSWADDNVFFDLAYRCKGLMPPDALRTVLEQARAVRDDISVELQSIGEAACGVLATWETTLPRPYQQGRALANWLRERLGTSAGRVDPEQFLLGWNVPVSMHDFSTRSLDAVASWAHGRRPTILCNSSEKHRLNEGARRATLAHEICHLLVDRYESLPLSAVVGGAMEQIPEKRANAFAAHFLCPQQEAGAEFRRAADVTEAVTRLTMRFGVSKELASIQLANSGEVNDLDAQAELESLGPPNATYPWSR